MSSRPNPTSDAPPHGERSERTRKLDKVRDDRLDRVRIHLGGGTYPARVLKQNAVLSPLCTCFRHHPDFATVVRLDPKMAAAVQVELAKMDADDKKTAAATKGGKVSIRPLPVPPSIHSVSELNLGCSCLPRLALTEPATLFCSLAITTTAIPTNVVPNPDQDGLPKTAQLRRRTFFHTHSRSHSSVSATHLPLLLQIRQQAGPDRIHLPHGAQAQASSTLVLSSGSVVRRSQVGPRSEGGRRRLAPTRSSDCQPIRQEPSPAHVGARTAQNARRDRVTEGRV